MRLLLALYALTATLCLAAAPPPSNPDGNRLAYLDENNPYYPGRDFPKLTTPQWVGEPGVEAVVVLAIDDMRDPSKYEAYLRPILNRLKAIDGRAPVSIMTCQVKPDDPQIQSWLKEGLNLDVHTIAHPCPLLQKGDFAAAKKTVDDCIDLLNKIPNNRPVAFRMPCCDSLNTPSPRFYAEIFNKTTSAEHYLSIDSSVFNILTPDDPALPRSLVQDPDGGERFRKYVPFKSFVNTIENYPYPYVINRLCWEFPCVVPSDWEAQHVQKPFNPKTVEDMKAALDAIVMKQGVFNLVFHPHGWIKSEQIVELIDHAVAKHGKKVKFLNFREALERLDKNLLGGQSLRDSKGQDNGVRVLDLDNDGFMDVVIGNADERETRVWDVATQQWKTSETPVVLVKAPPPPHVDVNGNGPSHYGARFGILRGDGHASMILHDAQIGGCWHFDRSGWTKQGELGLPKWLVGDRCIRLRDIDHDGRCELIHSSAPWRRDQMNRIYSWSERNGTWETLPIRLPEGACLRGSLGPELKAVGPGQKPTIIFLPLYDDDTGLRFVDLDEDGDDDIVFSNGEGYGVFLFESLKAGWDRKVSSGKADDPGAIPKTVRETEEVFYNTDNGFWVHSRHLWWQNEDTAKLPDLVDRRSFNDLLKDIPPQGKSAEASRKAIRVRPGFKVELAAAEPLVQDPIAFEWGADGKLWVLEMGDYPLGNDGKGKPGGQVRLLEDTNGDGTYDKMSLFVEGLSIPSGLMPWRNGVLVGAAPDIFYAEDRDGDGKADFREVLFTGFHPGNPQHRLNGFELGLDGWVYGANGDSGGNVKSLKTGKTVDIRGRDFRFKPDTGEFEAESGMTQYGRHRDDWGRWFGNNNPNWAWHYVLADADLKRNTLYPAPDPRKMLEPDTRLYPVSRTAPRFNDPGAANRVTSANSATPYRDDLFGEHFSNVLFVSEPVHNLVHAMIVEGDGPSLKARRLPGEAEREFLASSDAWFRPTMLKTGPDGALWVADMDRAVIEHPEWIPDDWEARLDLRAGADRGRIFRVLPVDKTARPIPRLDTLDTLGLVAALNSPNGWQRDTVQRLLLHKNDPAAIAPLRKLASETTHPKVKVQALWTLETLGGLDPEGVVAGLNHTHPQVRRNAARLAGKLAATSPTLADALVKCATDADASVRFEVALALGNWDDPRAGRALAAIAQRDGSDQWFRAAIMSSAPPHVGTMLASLFSGKETPPASMVEPLFILAGSLKDRSGLRGLIQSVGTPAGSNRAFASWQFSAMAGLLDASARAGKPLGEWLGNDPATKEAATRLEPLWSSARSVVARNDADIDTRMTAAKLLGRDARRHDAERSLVGEVLTPQVPVEVQLAVLSALGRSRDPKLPEALLAGWKKQTPAVRSAVLDMLLSRSAWSGSLLSSLEDLCTPAAEIDPAHRRRLLESSDKTLRERATAVFGANSTTKAELLKTYRPALTSPGDPTAGAEVFKKVCATCHKLGAVGTEVGPDLAALEDRSPEAILIAVLDPNRAFESKYSEFTVHLSDGRIRAGMIASETSVAVTLRRQQAEQDVILRADIEEMIASGRSLMPEGLEKDLKPSDVANLIAFITATAPAARPKQFAGNSPEVVQAGRDGSIVLEASAAEIHGDTLVFESKYGNIGYWSSDNDRAGWRYDGAKAGRYQVWIDWACENSTAGQSLVLQLGGTRLVQKVGGTGSWDTYKRAMIGVVSLPAGAGRLDVRPEGTVRGPLLDLRMIELRYLGER